MHNKTISELGAGLRTGEFSSVELTRYFLDRIEVLNAKLNSFITIDHEGALVAAKSADQCLMSGNAEPLTGIPMAHKDLFATNGLLTTCGSGMLSNFIAPYDATVVRRCRKAGMVCLGKTNMDEFAMGSSTETSYFGPTRNPWDLNAVPGGTSGGSAAAVAGGLAPICTATDTGGSIRQPASFCGVTGIKPTYGRVSRYGLIAHASSLDQGGVIARSAKDVALLLSVIAGFDPRDSTSVDRPVPDYITDIEQPFDGLKIGVPAEYFTEGLDADVQHVIENALGEFEAMGA